MMNSITLGQYIPADSAVHRLDPRCKLLLTVAAMVAIFMSDSLPSIFLWGLFLPYVAHNSKIPFTAILRSAKPVLFLIVFTSLMHLFLTPGDPVVTALGMTITAQGIFLAFKLSMRLLYLVMYASILSLTTSPSELSDGLELLMSPLKRIGFPAHETAMMMTIALRFIPTLFEETERIMKSQASRGADFESGGLIKRAKSYIPILIPMFVLIFQRADTLASAMEARCYRGGRGRVRMYPLTWKKADSAASLLFLSFIIFAVCADRFIQQCVTLLK